MECLTAIDDRGEKLTKNSLKKLEGVTYPKHHVKVAFAMQKPPTTLRSLHTHLHTIITQQWVMMHLDHPRNGDWVLPEKVVCR